MYIKDSVICLKTVEYSETSQIATFFTEKNGKVSGIAKGSRRKKSAFESPLEPLNQGDVIFAGTHKKGLATISEFNQNLQLQNLSRDFFAYNCALFSAELLMKFTEEYDSHPRLYRQAVMLLQEICQEPSEHSFVLMKLIFFQMILLQEAGIMPIFDECGNCKADFNSPAFEQVYFSSSANGFICRDCENSFPDKIRITRKSAEFLNAPERLNHKNKNILIEIEHLIIQHLRYLNGKDFRMSKYISSF
jgi:DNA repair protein RecO (recombination protein O)